MRTYIICCVFLLKVIVGVFASEDYESTSQAGFLTGNTTLEMQILNNYKDVQVAIFYNLYSYQNTTNFTTPIQFSTQVFDPVDEKNFTIAVVNITSAGNKTFLLSPCDLGFVTNGTIFRSIAQSITKLEVYNISMQIYIMETGLGVGRTLDSTLPLCPGARYLSMDIPVDGHGYNITLTTEDVLLQTGFTGIYLSLNACPTLDSFQFQLSNVSEVATDDGYTFENLKEGGKWWFMFTCANSTGWKWDLTAKEDQTCLVGCLERGYCDGNAPEPFCICDYFHSGDDCSQLYPGDYSLMAVAGLAVLSISGYIGCKVRNRYKVHQAHKKRPLPIIVNPDPSEEERENLLHS